MIPAGPGNSISQVFTETSTVQSSVAAEKKLKLFADWLVLFFKKKFPAQIQNGGNFEHLTDLL